MGFCNSSKPLTVPKSVIRRSRQERAKGRSAGEAVFRNAGNSDVHGEQATLLRVCRKVLRRPGEAGRGDIEGAQVGAAEGAACRPAAGELDDTLDTAVRRKARQGRTAYDTAIPQKALGIEAGAVRQSAFGPVAKTCRSEMVFAAGS